MLDAWESAAPVDETLTRVAACGHAQAEDGHSRAFQPQLVGTSVAKPTGYTTGPANRICEKRKC
jgi:hypothetical protein